MKTNSKIQLWIFFILIGLMACSDPMESRFENDQKADGTIWELLTGRAEYSRFVDLIEETGMDSVLRRTTGFTVFAVANDYLPDMSQVDPIVKRNVVTNHVSNFVAYSSGLPNGGTLKMLTGKNIFVSEMAGQKVINDDVQLLETDLLATNGVIHEASKLIEVRPNLLEYILGHPEYSYLAAFFEEGTELSFDKINSIPIGIDEDGQTVYDTIWKQSNAFFDQVANLSSEDELFTIFLAENELLDTSASGSFKLGYLANPGSFIIEGLIGEDRLPGSFPAVDGFTLDIEGGNYELQEKLSNGYAYGLKGFEGIRIPKIFKWEVTDGSDFDSVRHIKSLEFASVYDQFQEIQITDLQGGFSSFKYEIFNGPLNKDYLKIITTAGTYARITFSLPDILPGKYLVKLGAQIRRVDGLYFDVYLNDEKIASKISLNGGDYNWALTNLGVGFIDTEKGNKLTIAILGNNNNYVRGYLDYLEFEPVN